MNKTAKLGMCVVVAAVLLLAYGVRLSAVNDGFKGFPKTTFEQGETATYATSSKSQNPQLAEGDVEVSITSFTGLSPAEVKNAYADDDPIAVVQADNGGDSELLAVGLSVKNCSTTDGTSVFVGSYELESVSWNNGVYLPLLPAMNAPDANAVLDLAPGEEKQIVLPFYIYDVQLGDNWKGLHQRTFDLVLSMQPKLYSIELGRFSTST